MDCHNKGCFATFLVCRIDMGSIQKGTILDGYGMKVTGTHSDEGVRRRLIGRRLHSKPIRCALCSHEQCRRRKKITLPGLRPDGVAEAGIVCALFQAVSSTVLFLCPADGQIAFGSNLFIDDSSITYSRTDTDEAAIL